MKLFLLTGDPKDIEWGASTGLIDGVATSTPLLASGGSLDDARARLAEICRATALPVVTAVPAVDRESIYTAGRELARLGDNVIVQVPMIEDAILPARRLVDDGVRLCVTLVYTVPQALLAARIGAAMVSTPLDESEGFGVDARASLAEMSSAMRDYGLSCEIFALAPRNVAEVSSCVAARADGMIVGTATLKRLLLHPLTDRGVDQMLHELSVLRRAEVTT